MKKILMYVLILALPILLAGCADLARPSETEVDVVDTEAAESAEAVLDLPVNIDVQTVNEIKDRDDVVVIDVREQWEYDEGHIPGVVHLPMNDIPGKLDEIPTDKSVVLTCRSGNRSNQVTQYLQENGFENVHNMLGGIVAWQDAGLEVEQ